MCVCVHVGVGVELGGWFGGYDSVQLCCFSGTVSLGFFVRVCCVCRQCSIDTTIADTNFNISLFLIKSLKSYQSLLCPRSSVIFLKVLLMEGLELQSAIKH